MRLAQARVQGGRAWVVWLWTRLLWGRKWWKRTKPSVLQRLAGTVGRMERDQIKCAVFCTSTYCASTYIRVPVCTYLYVLVCTWINLNLSIFEIWCTVMYWYVPVRTSTVPICQILSRGTGFQMYDVIPMISYLWYHRYDINYDIIVKTMISNLLYHSRASFQMKYMPLICAYVYILCYMYHLHMCMYKSGNVHSCTYHDGICIYISIW
jgi:hypothetical protein